MEITTNQINEAMSSFCPYGYRDIEKALEEIYTAEGKGYLPTDILFEICNDYADSTGTPIHKIDPVYCVYDYYHQMARTDIESKTGKDISNDDPYSSIDISGNYMCTSFDGHDEDFKALQQLIETIPEEERTPSVKWLLTKVTL